MTTTTLNSLLIAALMLSAHAYAGEEVAVKRIDGKTHATFTLGNSDCVLVDDKIRCTPASR